MPKHAVLIDPVALTVTDVEADLEDIHDIYKLIGADCFDVAHLEIMRGRQLLPISVFVDDEGLLKGGRSYFHLTVDPDSTHHPAQLAGKGLVTGGADRHGYTQKCPVVAEELARYVTFIIDWRGAPRRVHCSTLDLHRSEGRPVPPPWLDSEDRAAGGFRIVEIR